QGVTVLRIDAHGGTLTETPVRPAAENRAARRWEVALAADGGAEIAETLEITGQAAPEWREHYQTPGERAERDAKVWTGRHRGARLTKVEMPGIEDRSRPVRVRATASVPHLADAASGGALALPLGSREADFARTYARLSARKTDLVLAYPWRHEE